MKEDIAHLYKMILKKNFQPESIRMYTRDNYTNVAITFVRSANGGQVTHYIHIYE